MLTTRLNLSPILILITLFCRSSLQQICGAGWFGPDCRYKCWCSSNNCQLDGKCVNETACVTGWFGPSCQYKNLMTDAASNQFWVNDEDIGTCNPGTSIITADLDGNYHFTWLRIVFNGTELDKNDPPAVDLQFKDVSDYLTICTSRTFFTVDSKTVDIHCDIAKRIKQITLRGYDTFRICELFVNGGQNLALRQKTTQSSVYSNGGITYLSDLAVDGSREDYLAEPSCSCTDVKGDTNPTWSLNFAKSVIIYRAVLYNQDVDQDRLSNFTLKVFDVNGTLMRTYNGSGEEAPAHKVPFTKLEPVNKLSVQTSSVVTLCEIEIFGEIVCSPHKWGLDCLNDCQCQENELCSPVTGKCDAGCPSGLYGQSCDQTCHVNCLNEQCLKGTGRCIKCLAGRTGDYCDKACLPDTYGRDCNLACPSSCRKGSCDRDEPKPADGSDCSKGMCHGNGMCYECTDTERYGFNCTLECPINCEINVCNSKDGSCRSCKTGFYGKDCSRTCYANCKDACGFESGVCFDCKSPYYGDLCTLPCPATCIERSCYAQNGTCLMECPKGFFGAQCSSSCPPNCSEQVCHVTTGSCSHGCKAGLFGANCSGQCPLKCREQTCHATNGSCLKGCVEGLYGEKCSNMCPRRCTNNICDFNNGSCYTCTSGYHGLSCDFLCSEDCPSHACNINNGHCSQGDDGESLFSKFLPFIVGTNVFVIIMATLLRSRASKEDEEDPVAGGSGRRKRSVVAE